MSTDASLERQHLAGRDQSEKIFRLFGSLQAVCQDLFHWYSTNECMAIQEADVDIILVYGTSIIKGAILHKYDRKILNVHLGLSPYYRGSGTNYFPFVNNEPEFCGATYMYLDEGIDTGEIIHQIRPHILSTDSFHQMSNRFLIKVFETYVLIAENYFDLGGSQFSSICFNGTRKFCKRKDFTALSVERLYSNFSSGMIQRYLLNYQERNNRFQLENSIIKTEG